MIEWVVGGIIYYLMNKNKSATALVSPTTPLPANPAGGSLGDTASALVAVARRPYLEALPGDDAAVDPMNPWRA